VDHITVRFELNAPSMNRHRVSVWDGDGALLSPPSADVPVDLSVVDGETFWVEASVPGAATRRNRAGRDERRWELRAANDAQAVLNVGPKGGQIEIRVDGATQLRASKKSA